MKKYFFFFFCTLFFSTMLFPCPKLDKVKEYVKEKIFLLVDGKSRDDLESEHGKEVKTLLEIYDYMENLDQ